MRRSEKQRLQVLCKQLTVATPLLKDSLNFSLRPRCSERYNVCIDPSARAYIPALRNAIAWCWTHCHCIVPVINYEIYISILQSAIISRFQDLKTDMVNSTTVQSATHSHRHGEKDIVRTTQAVSGSHSLPISKSVSVSLPLNLTVTRHFTLSCSRACAPILLQGICCRPSRPSSNPTQVASVLKHRPKRTSPS